MENEYGCREYLIVLREAHEDFRAAELASLLELYGMQDGRVLDEVRSFRGRMYVVRLGEAHAEVFERVCERAVLVQFVVEIWGKGMSNKEVSGSIDIERERARLISEETWRFKVFSAGLKLGKQETVKRREDFLWSERTVVFKGKVDVNNAQNTYILVYDYMSRVPQMLKENSKKSKRRHQVEARWLELKEQGLKPREIKATINQERSAQNKERREKSEDSSVSETSASKKLDVHEIQPDMVYFGRLIADADQSKIAKEYTLKNRTFLGPTSMDARMSFIMANQGHVKPGALVLDPYVGTGSLLIPCAVHQAICQGTDIDYWILKGKNGQNLFHSFDQYNLQHPEIVRMDFSARGISFRESLSSIYDAIICDPPYGIRAGAKKCGRKPGEKVREVHDLESYVTPLQNYDAGDLMVDLFDASARLLKSGGRLVVLIPVDPRKYCDAMVPTHSCLKCVSKSMEVFRAQNGRVLATLVKIADYDFAKIDEYRETTRAKLVISPISVSLF